MSSDIYQNLLQKLVLDFFLLIKSRVPPEVCHAVPPGIFPNISQELMRKFVQWLLEILLHGISSTNRFSFFFSKLLAATSTSKQLSVILLKLIQRFLREFLHDCFVKFRQNKILVWKSRETPSKAAVKIPGNIVLNISKKILV